MKNKIILIPFQKLTSVVEKGERIIKTADNCSKLMVDDDDDIVIDDEYEKDGVSFKSNH